jgi:hypothetical protein
MKGLTMKLERSVSRLSTVVAFCSIPSGAQRPRNDGAEIRALTNGVTPEDLRRMKTSTWLNQHQTMLLVNFSDLDTNPYPPVAYDVTIEKVNCYVVFRDPEKNTYDMISSKQPPMDGVNYGVFLSHEAPCGVCSNLVDLAVYLETPALTNPVRLCGFTGVISGEINKECLSRIGFSEPCAAIWFHNTQHTRTNCLLLCLANLLSPPNIGFGFFNPCQPSINGTDQDGDNDGRCQNTINRQPACQKFQYQTGSRYRLNSCLQCDECNSGPLFQKIAGRTRRFSGIVSDIDRPDIPQINHNYFTANITTVGLK